jgi:hypothetical protein
MALGRITRLMNQLVQAVEWLEMFVLWIAAIIATLALLLSVYNTYTLHMLRRRELEALRGERRQSVESRGPTEGTGAQQEGTERQTSWWRRVFGG